MGRRGGSRRRESFPGGSEVKESACNAGDLGSIPGLGRSNEALGVTPQAQPGWQGQSQAAAPGLWLCPHALVPGGLFTGKVVLQGGEEVSDDRHAPGPPKQLLTGHTAHVGDVCVVYREADPQGSRGGGGSAVINCK